MPNKSENYHHLMPKKTPGQNVQFSSPPSDQNIICIFGINVPAPQIGGNQTNRQHLTMTLLFYYLQTPYLLSARRPPMPPGFP